MNAYLLLVCSIALVAVMLLLGLLAATIRGITALFPPPREGQEDEAIVAAVGALVAARFGGARLVQMQEEKRK